MPIGSGTIATSIGSTGGSKDSINVAHSHTATSTSTVTDPGHSHVQRASTSTSGASDNTARLGYFYDASVTSNTATTGISVATSTTVASAGTTVTNANLPPYLGINFIIKT